MEVDPPSAMTRFGMFFLAGAVALIFATWGVLKWLDQPRTPSHPEKAPVVTSSQALKPR